MRYPDHKGTSIFDVSNTLFTIIAIMFHASVEFKHSSISAFITKYKSLMTREYKDRVEAVASRNLVLFCLFFVVQYLMTFCNDQPFFLCEVKKDDMFMGSRNITLLDAILIHAAVPYGCLVWQCWMAMSFCLFNYCLTMKQEVIRCKLNQLFILIMSRDSNGSMLRLEQAVITFVQTIQDEFDSCFSIFPFLVFGANFIQASGYLMYELTLKEEDAWSRIPIVMISLLWLTVSLIMSMTAHSGKNEEVAKRVAHLLNKPNMTAYDANIIRSIKEILVRKESAWLFELDKLVILPFAGHVISFSALFMQLMTPKELNSTAMTSNLSSSSFT